MYIVGPLIAAILGGFSHEVIFSYCLDSFHDHQEAPESDPVQDVAEKEIAVSPNDIVLTNKINGELAYD